MHDIVHLTAGKRKLATYSMHALILHFFVLGVYAMTYSIPKLMIWDVLANVQNAGTWFKLEVI